MYTGTFQYRLVLFSSNIGFDNFEHLFGIEFEKKQDFT